MKNKRLKSTLDIDYEAPFKMQLEKHLPQILAKLIESNKNGICSTIRRVLDDERSAKD